LQAGELLSRLDALIFTGGGDIDPSLYGGAGHEMIYSVDRSRDLSEIGLAREVVNLRLPTLGICRGIQLINVALGGTLIAHLPDVYGDAVPHRLSQGDPKHLVRVAEGSRLASVLATQECDVVSSHHQAIWQPASSLQVVAHAPDGTIEAVEMPEHPWLVGVQWHPELSAATDATQQRLFNALVTAAVECPRPFTIKF
jgi:putative glutamine amidotransferase